MKVPPEILNKIFKKSESNPSNVRHFGKYMSTKTKNKMLNCKNVIDTGNLQNVKLLKFHNVVCSKSDLMHAVNKGYTSIVKYIHNTYPEAQINYTDIMNALLDNKANNLRVLLSVYKFNGVYEYLTLWSLVNPEHKKLMRILLDFKPTRHPIELSFLFEDPLNFMVASSGFYLRSLMSISKNDVIVDDNFIIKLLNSREFDLAKELSFYNRMPVSNRKMLLHNAIANNDNEMISYLVNYQKATLI